MSKKRDHGWRWRSYFLLFTRNEGKNEPQWAGPHGCRIFLNEITPRSATPLCLPPSVPSPAASRTRLPHWSSLRVADVRPGLSCGRVRAQELSFRLPEARRTLDEKKETREESDAPGGQRTSAARLMKTKDKQQ